jgi:hypothetical protein
MKYAHNFAYIVGGNADQRFTDAATLLDWGFQLPLLPPTASR